MEKHVGTKMLLTHYQRIWLNSKQGMMRLANDVNRGATWEATQDFNNMLYIIFMLSFLMFLL